MNNQSLGKRITFLRKKQGLSQQQLGDLLGLARQSISKWESDKAVPDITYIIQMGEIFHVTMDYLILGHEDCSPKAAPNDIADKKYFIIPYILFMILGVILLFLLPLFSTLYRNYIFASTGVAYTSPTDYLHEWPLNGIVWISILFVLVGLLGILWNFRKKLFHFS